MKLKLITTCVILNAFTFSCLAIRVTMPNGHVLYQQLREALFELERLHVGGIVGDGVAGVSLFVQQTGLDHKLAHKVLEARDIAAIVDHAVWEYFHNVYIYSCCHLTFAERDFISLTKTTILRTVLQDNPAALRELGL